MQTAVLLTSTLLGNVNSEDKEFGKTMMENFLHSLENKDNHADYIVCYTEGVKNAVKGTQTALSLEVIQSTGTKILLCTSCLNYYKIEDGSFIGEKSNMAEITNILIHSDRLIRP